jgi:hypothetical protein
MQLDIAVWRKPEGGRRAPLGGNSSEAGRAACRSVRSVERTQRNTCALPATVGAKSCRRKYRPSAVSCQVRACARRRIIAMFDPWKTKVRERSPAGGIEGGSSRPEPRRSSSTSPSMAEMSRGLPVTTLTAESCRDSISSNSRWSGSVHSQPRLGLRRQTRCAGSQRFSMESSHT